MSTEIAVSCNADGQQCCQAMSTMAAASSNSTVADLIAKIAAAAPSWSTTLKIVQIVIKCAADIKAGDFASVIADLQALLAAVTPTPVAP